MTAIGRVGFGTGKAQEVPEVIRKAAEDAKKLDRSSMVVQLFLTKFFSEFGGAKVLLKPVVEGLWSCCWWCCSCRRCHRIGR